MTGTPKPGAEATQIAALPLPRADHSADLPPASVPPVTPAPGREAVPPAKPPRVVGWIVMAALILAALFVWGLT